MDDPIGVIFDLDGVLVDSYQAHYRSWLEMAASEGLQFTEAEFARTFGRTSREIIKDCWGKSGLEEAKIAEMDRRKEAIFRRMVRADFPAMPGAVELLRTLHTAGFRLALGSSGPPENVDFTLQWLDAKDLFQAVVTGRDVQRGKPDPQVFLIAAERLGVPPHQSVVIEDAPVGVAAANAAGMTSIGLMSTGRNAEDLAAAHAVVRSLGEITPSMLRRLVSQRRSSCTPSSPQGTQS